MGDIDAVLEVLNQYVRSELMILAPVLYFVIKILKKSRVNDRHIPALICILSVVLSGVYTFSTVCAFSLHSILLSIFSSVTQGIILAGCALFGAVLVKAHGERRCACEEKKEMEQEADVEKQEQPIKKDGD